jgi:hypothetical protein
MVTWLIFTRSWAIPADPRIREMINKATIDTDKLLIFMGRVLLVIKDFENKENLKRLMIVKLWFI